MSAVRHYWMIVSTDDIAAIEAAGLAELAASMRAKAEEIDSPEAAACRREATDDDGHTPEWDGPVSFCEEDNKTWVLTWELVTDPNAPDKDENQGEVWLLGPTSSEETANA